MALNTPSSLEVGSRPRMPRTSSYSSVESPCSATSSGVIAGSPGRALTDTGACLRVDGVRLREPAVRAKGEAIEIAATTAQSPLRGLPRGDLLVARRLARSADRRADR